MKYIAEQLEQRALAHPDQPLFVFLDHEGREKAGYTYATFAQRSRDVAEHLSRHEGLRSGDRVLLAYPPGLELVVAFYACARIGVIPVPVYPLGPAGSLDRMRRVATDCGATAILSAGEPAADASDSGLRWITTDTVTARASAGFRDRPGEVLFLQYTSGSTAAPRGVIVSHENVIHNAKATVDHVAVGVSWLPQYHDMGLIGYYLFPVVTGATTYGLSPSDFLKRPALWLQTISRVRATYTSSPNFGFDYCLRPGRIKPADLEGVDLSCLRVVMNAAEPVRADTVLRFHERFAPYGLHANAHVVAYGLAENTLAATHYGRRILAVDKRRLRNHAVAIVDGTDTAEDEYVRLASCGRLLDGIRIRIVHPESRTVVPDRTVGEIWIAGGSVCRGYWGAPQSTSDVFANTLNGDGTGYLRTGDLGFLHDGELFVSGRMKDVIILRGVNVYPQDIEGAVEAASPTIRAGGVAAFAGEDDALVVVAEVKSARNLPDPHELARAIRVRCFVEPRLIVLAPPHAIVRTTSGKIARGPTRERFRGGALPSILIHDTGAASEAAAAGSGLRARFHSLFALCQTAPDQSRTFAELGIDSVMLAELLLDLESLLAEQGAHALIGEIDAPLLQRLTLADFSRLLDRLEQPTPEAVALCRQELRRIRTECDTSVRARMRADARLSPNDLCTIDLAERPIANVLMTGATGFFGPFLFASLLRRTPYTYHVLVRAKSRAAGMERLRDALRQSMLWSASVEEALERRVRILCGNVSRENLDLPDEEWTKLSREIDAVVHNAALVNYVLNYDVLKPHNVDGTRTLLRFAHSGRRKEFHFVSTTFIFGWTAKGFLAESDHNEEMSSLDFGYSQTKWVAEQLVRAAAGRGLPAYVYRPSLLSASTRGVGDRNDVAIRMLCFMIRHGIAVDTKNQLSILPVDQAADNVAAVIHQPRPDARSFHVTAEGYYNMKDVTEQITADYGYRFTYYDIPGFIEQMNRRCTKADPLYPLLDFFNRSAAKIAAMQLKRYQNVNYLQVRGQSDPTLRETVSYMMEYMQREGLIAQAAV